MQELLIGLDIEHAIIMGWVTAGIGIFTGVMMITLGFILVSGHDGVAKKLAVTYFSKKRYGYISGLIMIISFLGVIELVIYAGRTNSTLGYAIIFQDRIEHLYKDEPYTVIYHNEANMALGLDRVRMDRLLVMLKHRGLLASTTPNYDEIYLASKVLLEMEYLDERHERSDYEIAIDRKAVEI